MTHCLIVSDLSNKTPQGVDPMKLQVHCYIEDDLTILRTFQNQLAVGLTSIFLSREKWKELPDSNSDSSIRICIYAALGYGWVSNSSCTQSDQCSHAFGSLRRSNSMTSVTDNDKDNLQKKIYLSVILIK